MKKVISLIFLAVLSVSLYTLTLRGVSGEIKPSDVIGNLDQATKPLELSPERGRFLLTMSLVQDRSFALRKELGIAALPDVGVHDGRFYIFFAPGISILGVPFYLLGKMWNIPQVTTFAMVSFFAILNLTLLFLIARKYFKFSYSLSLLIPVIFGFATTSWSYANTLYQHHITLFFILSSLYVGLFYQSKSKGSWLASFYMWASYGAAVWLDYPNGILLLPIVIYFFLSSFSSTALKTYKKVQFRLSFILTVIGFISLIGLHGYYNYVNFGAWNKLSGSISSYKQVQESEKKNNIKIDIEKVSNTQRNVISYFAEDSFPRGFSILTASRDRGLLFYSPILVLGILGMLFALTKLDLFKATLIGLITVNLFLYSSWGDPWGGWAYGPRYLIPTMAVLSLFLGATLTKLKNLITSILVRLLTFALFIYSSAVSLLGALTTNAVPPKIEADFLKMKYNYMHNLIFYENGRSSSFLYNEYLAKFLTLQQFFYIIWGSLLFIVLILLFVIPLFEKNNESVS